MLRHGTHQSLYMRGTADNFCSSVHISCCVGKSSEEFGCQIVVWAKSLYSTGLKLGFFYGTRKICLIYLTPKIFLHSFIDSSFRLAVKSNLKRHICPSSSVTSIRFKTFKIIRSRNYFQDSFELLYFQLKKSHICLDHLSSQSSSLPERHAQHQSSCVYHSPLLAPSYIFSRPSLSQPMPSSWQPSRAATMAAYGKLSSGPHLTSPPEPQAGVELGLVNCHCCQLTTISVAKSIEN
jgi:hypothetical protein